MLKVPTGYGIHMWYYLDSLSLYSNPRHSREEGICTPRIRHNNKLEPDDCEGCGHTNTIKIVLMLELFVDVMKNVCFTKMCSLTNKNNGFNKNFDFNDIRDICINVK